MKLLLVLAAAATLASCRFWYKPVPVDNAIGEEEAVLAGDTLKVYRDSRFEVYGPSPEAVYDGYEQLNRAYRAFERHFGAPAPRLAFVLFSDTVVPIDSATRRAFRSRGYTVVEYQRPRGARTRRRGSSLDYGGVMWPVAPAAARMMLARFTESQLGSDAPHSVVTLLERYPAWYRAAVFHLIGEAGAFANDLDYVRERRPQWWHFRDLLTFIQPAAGDTVLDPSRRSEADDQMRMFAAQSSTLGRFLIEREGPGVLGRLGRGYLGGRSITEMVGELRSTPRTVPELEQRWKGWLETVVD